MDLLTAIGISGGRLASRPGNDDRARRPSPGLLFALALALLLALLSARATAQTVLPVSVTQTPPANFGWRASA